MNEPIRLWAMGEGARATLANELAETAARIGNQGREMMNGAGMETRTILIPKMTLSEVAREFGVTVRTIANWRKALAFPVVECGGMKYCEPDAVRAWWEDQKRQGVGK
jgi:hypothetical protein